jgi:hypothetical protein
MYFWRIRGSDGDQDTVTDVTYYSVLVLASFVLVPVINFLHTIDEAFCFPPPKATYICMYVHAEQWPDSSSDEEGGEGGQD